MGLGLDFDAGLRFWELGMDLGSGVRFWDQSCILIQVLDYRTKIGFLTSAMKSHLFYELNYVCLEQLQNQIMYYGL